MRKLSTYEVRPASHYTKLRKLLEKFDNATGFRSAVKATVLAHNNNSYYALSNLYHDVQSAEKKIDNDETFMATVEAILDAFDCAAEAQNSRRGWFANDGIDCSTKPAFAGM